MRLDPSRVMISGSMSWCVLLLALRFQFFMCLRRFQQLKALEKVLEDLRNALPKSKFAFKRKAGTVPSSSTSVTVPLERSTIPPSSNHEPATPGPSANIRLSSHSHRYFTSASLAGTGSQASDLTLSDLDHCIVNLLSPPSGDNGSLDISAVHVRNVRNSLIILPIMKGSVLVNEMHRCVFVVGCHQVRFRGPLFI